MLANSDGQVKVSRRSSVPTRSPLSLQTQLSSIFNACRYSHLNGTSRPNHTASIAPRTSAVNDDTFAATPRAS
jgi:hypothetical protein